MVLFRCRNCYGIVDMYGILLYYTQASPVDPVGKGLFLAVTGWAPKRLYCRPPPPRASWRTTWQCSGVQDDVLIPSDMTHMSDLIWRAPVQRLFPNGSLPGMAFVVLRGNLESRSHFWNIRRVLTADCRSTAQPSGLAMVCFPRKPLPRLTQVDEAWNAPVMGCLRWSWWTMPALQGTGPDAGISQMRRFNLTVCHLYTHGSLAFLCP